MSGDGAPSGVSAVEERLAVGADGEELAVRWWRPRRSGGSAVLYMHGFGSSQDGEKAGYFRRRLLEAGAAFCSFDFRGHGDSGGSLSALTFTRNLGDLAAVYDWLAARWDGPVVFFGSSMGGATALWAAAREPERFAAGLAIAPALGMEASLARRVGEDGMEHWRTTGSLRLESELVSTDMGWGLMEDLARYRPEALGERYRTPSLIFQGLRDDSVDWRMVSSVVEACSEHGGGAAEVELHLFAAGDHRLLAHRDVLWDLTRGFLQRRGLLTAAGPG